MFPDATCVEGRGLLSERVFDWLTPDPRGHLQMTASVVNFAVVELRQGDGVGGGGLFAGQQ